MVRSQDVLPFAKESTTRLLPWIVGVMVYLAAVMMAGAMLLAGVAADWNRDLTGSFTVQIPPAEKKAAGSEKTRVDRVIKLLRETPGVLKVTAIPAKETALSLEPWLGANFDAGDLPLPRVVDVTLDRTKTIDLIAVGEKLQKAVPGAGLDSHEFWRDQILSLVHALGALAAVVIALIGGTCVSAVVFATRGGVAVHKEVIEVLHLIGATDDFIARQFQRQAFRIALIGSLFGAIVAVVTLFAIARFVTRLDAVLLPTPQLAVWQWCILALVPLFASFIVTSAARRTVLRTLRQML